MSNLLISESLPHPSSLRICSGSHLPWRTKKDEQTNNKLRPQDSKRTSVSKVFIIKQEICCLRRKLLQILFSHDVVVSISKEKTKTMRAVTSKLQNQSTWPCLLRYTTAPWPVIPSRSMRQENASSKDFHWWGGMHYTYGYVCMWLLSPASYKRQLWLLPFE